MSVRTLRYNTATQHFTKSALASTDRDALAFLEAAQIYNTNQQRAIVNLVRSLKRVGLWTKIKAIYPFVGGTASSHKWNLKDPRDVDAAFRLVFNGGWTHGANGATPNGTNGWADTKLTTSAAFTSNTSGSYAVYLRTDNKTNSVDIGSWPGDGGYTYMQTYYAPGPGRSYRVNCAGGEIYVTPVTITNGFFVASRRSNSDIEGYRQGVSEKTGTHGAQSSLTTNKTIGLGALNGFGSGGTPALWSNREIAFAIIGTQGITTAEQSTLYNINNEFQKRLGRLI